MIKTSVYLLINYIFNVSGEWTIDNIYYSYFYVLVFRQIVLLCLILERIYAVEEPK